MRRYPIKEAFLTLQGEGAFVGSRAVFLRTSGCNVWSGREQDRDRDAVKGVCARWCDTNFFGTDGERGGLLTALEIAALVRELWAHAGPGRVVVTGGEPSLVLDEELVGALCGVGMAIHVETNGSRHLSSKIDWVTLSPKPPMPVVDQHYSETKVVYPAVDPLQYEGLAGLQYVQPLDDMLRQRNTERCVDFVRTHPQWRLSLQTHKALGLP